MYYRVVLVTFLGFVSLLGCGVVETDAADVDHLRQDITTTAYTASVVSGRVYSAGVLGYVTTTMPVPAGLPPNAKITSVSWSFSPPVNAPLGQFTTLCHPSPIGGRDTCLEVTRLGLGTSLAFNNYNIAVPFYFQSGVLAGGSVPSSFSIGTVKLTVDYSLRGAPTLSQVTSSVGCSTTTLSAKAVADVGAGISSVAFLIDNVEVGRDSTATNDMYSVAVATPAVGSHTYQVIATDADGLRSSANGAKITVTLTPPTLSAPVVTYFNNIATMVVTVTPGACQTIPSVSFTALADYPSQNRWPLGTVVTPDSGTTNRYSLSFDTAALTLPETAFRKQGPYRVVASVGATSGGASPMRVGCSHYSQCATNYCQRDVTNSLRLGRCVTMPAGTPSATQLSCTCACGAGTKDWVCELAGNQVPPTYCGGLPAKVACFGDGANQFDPALCASANELGYCDTLAL